MGVISRGIRNAFRNSIRTLSIVLILGLSIGLALVMLLAHQAVGQKIKDVKATVGNTITIQPTGYNPLSQANNAVTTDELTKVKSLSHITGVTETLTDRLTTIGSSSVGGESTGNNQTSLVSPVTLQGDGSGGNSSKGGGTILFIAGGGALPANFSPPILILGTTDPAKLANGTDATITSGQMINGTKNVNDAMVSTDMASKNNLKIGSTFTAYGATLTVAGIFDSGTKGGNDVVVVSLPALERLSGQGNVVSEATAFVDSADNLASATSAVKRTLTNADVTSSLDVANNEIQPLQNVSHISLISLIGALIAAGMIVLMTMIMIVRERRREIGILKAIGASNLKVVFQFMVESLTLTIMASIIGLIIGISAGSPITNALVKNSATTQPSGMMTAGDKGTVSMGGGGPDFRRPTGGFVTRAGGGLRNSISNIHANVGWSLLAYGFGVAVLVAVVGAGSAGWLIAKVRPAEVLRSE